MLARLLVLESDQTIEKDFRLLTDFKEATYHARLANDVIVTPKTLSNMEKELLKQPAFAKILWTKSMGMDAHRQLLLLAEKVQAIIEQVHPNVPSTNPLTAAKLL